MKLKRSTMIWIFIWCIFIGVFLGGSALGALYPPVNYVAQPFVCPGGHMDWSSETINVSPVETVYSRSLYCVDGTTGARTELGPFPLILYSGTFYGLLLFLIVFLVIKSGFIKYYPIKS